MLDLHAVLTVFCEIKEKDRRESVVLHFGTTLSNYELIYNIPYPKGTESAQNFTFSCFSFVRKESGK